MKQGSLDEMVPGRMEQQVLGSLDEMEHMMATRISNELEVRHGNHSINAHLIAWS